MTSLAPVAVISSCELTPAARDFALQSKAPNTLKAYRSDWKHFQQWCAREGRVSLPASPGAVASYLSDLAPVAKVSTIARRLASISQVHQMAGYESPASSAHVRTVMQGIRRAKGTAPQGKSPALTNDIRAMVAGLPDGLLGVRDRALLLTGFLGAFRRSELTALDVGDLEFRDDGVAIQLRRSKTDQTAEGCKIGIPYSANANLCPVLALQEWISAAGLTEGPLFRPVTRHGRVLASRLSSQSIALIVKRSIEAIGRDPQEFAGHSLRSGFATSAAMGGASERSIMAQTGHRSVATARRYIRDGSLFRDNAAAKVGL